MRKPYCIIIATVFFAVSLFLSSCNKDENFTDNELNIQRDESISNINKFNNRDELKNAINNIGVNTRSSSTTGFNSPIAESLVPNENFRKLLNNKGQIIVGDTICMIAREGTFYTHISNKTSLDTLSDFSKFQEVSTDLKKSDDIYLYNTFKNTQPEDIIVDPEWGVNPPSDPNPTPAPIVYNLQKDPVDIMKFPVMSTEPYTLIGKGLGGLFGNNSAHKIDIEHKRRLSAALYSYDYLVYSEIGLKAAVIKRRSLLHNWTKVNTWASGTVIGWEHIHFSYDLNIPDIPGLNEQTQKMKWGKLIGNLANVSTLYKFQGKVSESNIITIPIILDKEVEIDTRDIANVGIDLLTKVGLDYLKGVGSQLLAQQLHDREKAINVNKWDETRFQKVPVPGIAIQIIDMKNKKVHFFIGSDKRWSPAPSQVKVFDNNMTFEINYDSNAGILGSVLKSLANSMKSKAPNVETAYVYAYTTNSAETEIKGMVLKKTK